MTKIFVAGATGLIGTKLTKRLLEEGYEVAGLTRSQQGKAKLEDQGVTGFIGDVLKADTVESAIASYKPDIIINEITDLKQADMSANTRVRIEGTKNIVTAALNNDVQHIQSQSIAFVYEGGQGLATEETPLDYQSTGERKVTVDGVEALEQETARIPHHIILRYGLLYGPETWFGKDGMIYNQFIDGSVSMSNGIQSFIHIDDAVETAIQALSFEPGIYNVTDDNPVDGEAWAKWYAQLLNVNPTLNIEPAADHERGASNQKFRQQGGKLLYADWQEGMNPIK
ncbi:NAD(P)-dependent oxidoreductase [Staphylococcus sp. 18_1_E_LY]|uniref:NAD(P)-dependent oxidoreductase n=1 Tax=Staphylococcus lloydii TaxID=2781774 RepID=A0A7T1AZA5_9STAP|nr:NAD(P)-dependent oxidoreductase [Staphylococcus lloydii]MBF7019503.1 NAD(P)-dependent oxidoreductase [Staphylococcus lloydii]MBF7027230.1 NAD(P)-dependent oxidoreductase [Staphylococcus lloydii]QPM74870.1 NAD(P)-dependent oxidoreductase [Staphylococcus lloydii]